MERAGRLASVYVSGEAVPFTLEQLGTFEVGVYMLPLNPPLKTITNVWESTGNALTAESGTTTTNIKITNHGLVTGDVIMNITRNNITKTVTRIDANNLTVSAILGQTAGDTIETYKTFTTHTVNLIKGTITIPEEYDNGSTIASGTYYPITCVATAHDYQISQQTDMGDITPFLATHKKKMPLEKFASGTISYFDVIDTYFEDALTNGTEVFIDLMDGTGGRRRTKALIDKNDMKAAIGSPQSATVSFISTDQFTD